MSLYDCPHCHNKFGADYSEENVIHCPHCNGTVAIPDEEDIAVGTVIGGFEIVKLIGKGGMGRVYLAKQLSMNRLVALKVLPKILTRDHEALEQFFNEVRMSGRLQHANIVVAIDAGEEAGMHYLAMTYVDGETLEDKIENDRVSHTDMLKCTLNIADALDYVWSKHKLLHKDIKPGNIMIDDKPEAFLLDMGIAQHMGESKLAADGSILGSPFYMSPEQVQAQELDWRSDMYSLGATLYHALVGVPPFDADDVDQIVEMHVTTELPDPKDRNPEAKVATPVVTILKRMMEKNPNDRFSSWAEFQKAIRAFLNRKSVQGKKTTNVRKTVTVGKSLKVAKSNNGKPSRRRVKRKSKSSKTGLIIVSAVVALVVAGGGFFWFAKSAEVGRHYDEAMSMLKEHPRDYKMPLQHLLKVAGNAKMTGYGEKVSAQIKILKTKLAKQKENIKAYDMYYNQALKQCAAGQFKEALKTTELLVDVEQIDLIKKGQELRESILKELEKKAKQTDVKEVPEVKPEEPQDNAAQEKIVNEYLKQLKQEQNDARAAILTAAKKKDFDAAKTALDCVSNNIEENEEILREQYEKTQAWKDRVLAYIESAEQFWTKFGGCGTLVKGVEFDLGKLKLGLAHKIIDGKLHFRELNTKKKFRQERDINDCSMKILYPMMKKVRKKIGGNQGFFSFLLVNAGFSKAMKYSTEEHDATELSGFKYVYFRERLRKLNDYSRSKSKKAALKHLAKMKKTFNSQPEFQQALQDVKAESTSE